MGIGSWLSELFGTGGSISTGACQDSVIDHEPINPATGLPMIGALDIMGNPWGADLSPPDYWDHSHTSCQSRDISSIGVSMPDYSSPSFGHDLHHDW